MIVGARVASGNRQPCNARITVCYSYDVYVVFRRSTKL
jgi:hypothetical protein